MNEAKPQRQVIVIGDVHGQYEPFVLMLRHAGLIDGELNWCGGRNRLIQMGDIFDRGPQPKQVDDLLDRIQRQANASQGEVVRLVIDGDIPAVEDITYTTMHKIKKLLMVIAGNVPLEVNINKLSAQLESTRDQTLKMLYLLDRAGLLCLLTDKVKDYKHLVGPKKIYLNNTNLMYALTGKISEGTLRETFFANQVGAVSTLTMPKCGDFMADGRYLFEVGGSRKTFEQIADMPDSYLALDDMEIGSGNRIPLWMFGCLY